MAPALILLEDNEPETNGSAFSIENERTPRQKYLSRDVMPRLISLDLSEESLWFGMCICGDRVIEHGGKLEQEHEEQRDDYIHNNDDKGSETWPQSLRKAH